jgi:hypothetical protein
MDRDRQMSDNGFRDRQREITHIRQNYPLLYPISMIIALVGIGIIIGAKLFADVDGYVLNLYTEFISIVITVGLLGTLNRAWNRAQLKAELIRLAGSESNERARAAIEDLRHYKWLIEGLKNQNLQRANLSDVNLYGVDLSGVQLQNAQLEKTFLSTAKLFDAELGEANLTGANLFQADLRKANLSRANLTEADLTFADLRGANLFQCILTGANLFGAQFDAGTILPDYNNWQPGIDLTIYGAIIEAPEDEYPTADR